MTHYKDLIKHLDAMVFGIFEGEETSEEERAETREKLKSVLFVDRRKFYNNKLTKQSEE